MERVDVDPTSPGARRLRAKVDHLLNPHDDDLEYATDVEWREMVDRVCQFRLGHGIDEFLERWSTGEYHMGHSHDLHCDIFAVAILLNLD